MEFPHIQQMYKELHPQQLEVISIALPPRAEMESMLRENKTVLPTALESRNYDDSAAINHLYGGIGVKVWFVVDAARRVVYVGNYNPAKIRAAVEALGAHWERKGKFAPNVAP